MVPDVPRTSRVAAKFEFAPMPSLLLVLSQKKEELF